MIENMGDAYECVEELLYLVRCFAGKEQIEEALRHFCKYERGEADPKTEFNQCSAAYLETKIVMQAPE